MGEKKMYNDGIDETFQKIKKLLVIFAESFIHFFIFLFFAFSFKLSIVNRENCM